MDGDETSGPIDFDFFGEESQKGTVVNEIEQRNGIKRLSEGSLTTHVTKSIREDDNARPHNGRAGPCSSPDNSTDSDSGSNSKSDGGRSPRSVSSRSTNISVKVPTARDDSDRSDSSDNGGKSNVNISENDRENNNNSPIAIGKRSESPEHRNTPQTSQRKSVRPRTAKTRNHRKSWSSEDPSESESNSDKEDSDDQSRSFSSSHSDTKSSASESDSDTSVTDVSPLHSPERSPQSEDGKSKKRLKDRKADGVRFVDVTPGYSIHGKTRQQTQDTEARELSVLLRAVLEMDDYPDRSDLTSLQKNMNRPSSGKPRRGGTRPRSAHMPHQRMNMSFSNDEVQKIDRENQRLLKKILTTNKTHVSSNGSSRSSSSQHLSHSAVRRQREQRKIELENMKILQRIETAKASPTIRKENLVQHYQQQVQYSNQVGKSAHRPSSARRTGSTYVNKMAKASSMSSLNSDFSKSSVATGSTRSRPSSGNRSIMSDTRPPDHARPAWDEHWHVT